MKYTWKIKSDKNRKFKKSSDIVKSENEVKSDNENQGEWTVVGEKKKKGKKQSEKGKSDKNVAVKVMKSKNGNYWVSRIIKKKNCTFVQNWGQWGGVFIYWYAEFILIWPSFGLYWNFCIYRYIFIYICRYRYM